VNGRIGHGLRGGAAALGVSAGLLILASTTQTPDGFIHASFGGPLDIFGDPSGDVLAIGDGPADATELAALLQTPVKGTTKQPDTPFRVAFEAGSTPDTTALNVFAADEPSGLPTANQSLDLAAKPVVDNHGRVDCAGSVRCDFDPATNVTTVTYADGLVAIVQKINDLTVVAYKNATGHLPKPVQSLLPPAPTQVAPPLAAAAAPATAPATAPVLPPPASETAAAAVDPGPAAPIEDLGPELGATRGGPRVNVTRPPMDFTPGRGGSDAPFAGGSGTPANIPAPKLPNLDKVKDALDSVADAVNDAVSKVGKALGAGAAEKPTKSEKPES